jgi:hypothetical protein
LELFVLFEYSRHMAFPNENRSITPLLKLLIVTFFTPEAEFLVPDWRDIVDSDIGLSYQPAR